MARRLHAVRLVLQARGRVPMPGVLVGAVGLRLVQVAGFVLHVVLPARRIVGPLLGVEAREEPVEIVGVLELVADEHRGVRVVDDVLAEVQLVAQDVVDDAAEEGDVAATRIGTCLSATALVRVKRGSMWMTRAPRFWASTTHWKPTGWASAMLEPWMMMQSALARSAV